MVYEQDTRRRVIDFLHGVYRGGEMLFGYKESCVMTVMALLHVMGIPDDKSKYLLRVGQKPGQAKHDYRHLNEFMSEPFGQMVVESALSMIEASEEESKLVRHDG